MRHNGLRPACEHSALENSNVRCILSRLFTRSREGCSGRVVVHDVKGHAWAPQFSQRARALQVPLALASDALHLSTSTTVKEQREQCSSARRSFPAQARLAPRAASPRPSPRRFINARLDRQSGHGTLLSPARDLGPPPRRPLPALPVRPAACRARPVLAKSLRRPPRRRFGRAATSQHSVLAGKPPRQPELVCGVVQSAVAVDVALRVDCADAHTPGPEPDGIDRHLVVPEHQLPPPPTQYA